MDRFFCEQCWREKELKSEWTLEDKRDKSTGACDSCFHCHLTTTRVAYWWQSGRPTFYQFSNMAPKTCHSGSWQICYRVTRDFRKCLRKRSHLPALQVLPALFRWQALCILTQIFPSLPSKRHPKCFFCWHLSTDWSVMPQLCLPHKTHIYPPLLHSWNLAEVFFSWFLCAPSNWFVSIMRIGFWFSLSFVSFHNN